MADSTLTLGWTELKQAVGHFIGYGSVVGSWSTVQEDEIELIVQTGYRRVLYPPAAGVIPAGFEWSFLRPSTTLPIVADDGDYDLPDDYGRVVGEFHYAADEHKASIRIISLAALLDMRSHSDQNSYPTFAATRFKSSDGTAGQLQEALFYPEPDDDYTLHYCYDAYTGQLSDTIAYPLGGMRMSELYKASCLAAAEIRNNEEAGLQNSLFQALLVTEVVHDTKRGTQHFGQMGQPGSVTQEEKWRRGQQLYDGAYDITYKGNQI